MQSGSSTSIENTNAKDDVPFREIRENGYRPLAFLSTEDGQPLLTSSSGNMFNYRTRVAGPNAGPSFEWKPALFPLPRYQFKSPAAQEVKEVKNEQVASVTVASTSSSVPDLLSKFIVWDSSGKNTDPDLFEEDLSGLQPKSQAAQDVKEVKDEKAASLTIDSASSYERAALSTTVSADSQSSEQATGNTNQARYPEVGLFATQQPAQQQKVQEEQQKQVVRAAGCCSIL